MTGKKGLISSCGQVDRVFSMPYIASYNELEQLHMQMLLNCYLAAFLNQARAAFGRAHLVS